VVPSVLDVYPRLRRRARRAVVGIRRLVAPLLIAFPDAALLARDPTAAERMDTTPHDHVVAHLLCAARALRQAISALNEPP
jgi:hypothetical protein